MNYDTLQAGPELDALVAEKVMGFKICRCLGLLSRTPDGETCTKCGLSAGLRTNYSRSISTAWLVVEKLRSMGASTTVTNDRTMDYSCAVGGTLYAWVNAETAPLAICSAALKAMGGGKI